MYKFRKFVCCFCFRSVVPKATVMILRLPKQMQQYKYQVLYYSQQQKVK